MLIKKHTCSCWTGANGFFIIGILVLILGVGAFATPVKVTDEKGSLTDTRDGRTYKTVTIGGGKTTQTWMAENLRYDDKRSVVSKNKYGFYYSGENLESICPDGWNVPSAKDFGRLASFAWNKCFESFGKNACDDDNDFTEKDLRMISKVLRSTKDWAFQNQGTNALGFNAFPAGAAVIGENTFQNMSMAAGFFSSTKTDDGSAILFVLEYDGFSLNDFPFGEVGFPIRCVKGSATASAPATSDEKNILTDSRDGKSYKTITIGSRIWMAENLNFKMPNSDCFKNKTEYCEKYGRRYTRNAAKKACPTGWHLPSKADFVNAAKYFGGEPDVDVKGNWFDMNDFTSKLLNDVKMPSGYYFINGKDPNVEDSDASFWTTSEDEEGYYSFFGKAKVMAIMSRYYENNKFSVRCIKD